MASPIPEASPRRLALAAALLLGWAAASAPASAASSQSLLLADGLMDREAVCAAYVAGQRAFIRDIAASWASARRDEAEQALASELHPLLVGICRQGWAVARLSLAEAIEARLPAADRAAVHAFLSSSAGRKLAAGARARALAALGATPPAPQPPLTREERAFATAAVATPSWARYKRFAALGESAFGQAQAAGTAPYGAEMNRRIQAVRARYAR